MIRKTRNLIIIFAFAAVLSALIVVTNKFDRNQEKVERSPVTTEQMALTNIANGSLRSLRIDNTKGLLKLSSMDGLSWIVQDTPLGYRIKDSLLKSITFNLSGIRGIRIDENPQDLTVYGLKNPLSTVTMTDVGGNESTVFFGNLNPSRNGRYTRLKSGSQVFLVPSSTANKAFWSLEDIREDHLPEVNLEAISSITIRSKSRNFKAVPHKEDLGPYRPLGAVMDVIEPWKSRLLIEDNTFQQTIASSPPPSLISGFPKESFENLSSIGLNHESDRIIIEDTDGGLLNLEIGSSDGRGYRYARESSYGETVFLIDEKDLKLLNTDPFSLTSKFVFLAGIDRVKEVEISGLGTSYLLEIDKLGNPDDDSDDIYRINGTETSERDFKEIYQNIIGLLCEGVAQNGIIDSEPELRIRYSHVNPDIPSRTIQFQPYDETYYLVEVEGEAPEFLIGRYQIQLMLNEIGEATGSK